MTYDSRIDAVTIVELYGMPFRVSPKYRGQLTEDERVGLIASSVRNLVDAIRYDAAGVPRCTAEDCTPASHDVLASFRRESAELLYTSLNFGFIPTDLPEKVRAVGTALGIDRAEIERLVAELGDMPRFRRRIRRGRKRRWLRERKYRRVGIPTQRIPATRGTGTVRHGHQQVLRRPTRTTRISNRTTLTQSSRRLSLQQEWKHAQLPSRETSSTSSGYWTR
ncbi:MAG: hypothetical protein QOH28_806 [Actinomycetota bacterium]|jgi:hypothetical protein|nr:hypothetical protein [Actinomycetota bacterium]